MDTLSLLIIFSIVQIFMSYHFHWTQKVSYCLTLNYKHFHSWRMFATFQILSIFFIFFKVHLLYWCLFNFQMSLMSLTCPDYVLDLLTLSASESLAEVTLVWCSLSRRSVRGRCMPSKLCARMILSLKNMLVYQKLSCSN